MLVNTNGSDLAGASYNRLYGADLITAVFINPLCLNKTKINQNRTLIPGRILCNSLRWAGILCDGRFNLINFFHFKILWNDGITRNRPIRNVYYSSRAKPMKLFSVPIFSSHKEVPPSRSDAALQETRCDTSQNSCWIRDQIIQQPGPV